jgi:TrmH family RNA methyltransferase
MTKTIRPQDITFILVRPRYPGNLGATARAIKNMGFSKMVLVRPAILPAHPEARRLAVGAEGLLKKAKVFETLEEAAKGMQFLVGTSRRTGKHRNDFIFLPELPEKLPPKQKIGILFGPEEKGLSNRDLAHCNLVVQIPSNPDFPSLNLAQSVIVTAYQLHLMQGVVPGKQTFKSPSLASVEQIEGMYGHLEKMLGAIGFFPHRNTFHMMRAIRQLFGRTGLTEREVRIFRGICRQVLWTAEKGGENEQRGDLSIEAEELG